MYLYSISKCLMFVSFRLVMNICSCDISVVRDGCLLVFDLEDIILYIRVIRDKILFYIRVIRDKIFFYIYEL